MRCAGVRVTPGCREQSSTCFLSSRFQHETLPIIDLYLTEAYDQPRALIGVALESAKVVT
ncbi:MAG: hypothetical protein OXC18_23380 [Desulfurellaceae bacterium]|nr:hypothetical protein [Desulfurellaceae bacterium]